MDHLHAVVKVGVTKSEEKEEDPSIYRTKNRAGASYGDVEAMDHLHVAVKEVTKTTSEEEEDPSMYWMHILVAASDGDVEPFSLLLLLGLAQMFQHHHGMEIAVLVLRLSVPLLFLIVLVAEIVPLYRHHRHHQYPIDVLAKTNSILDV